MIMKQLINKIKGSGGKLVLLSFGFLLATAGTGRAQCIPGDPKADLQAVSMDPSALVISPLGTIQLVIEMKNNGPCVIPIGEARFTVTFPDTHIQPAVPLNVTNVCGPNRWQLFNQTQAGGFYSLTFLNNGEAIPVGGTACPMSFNIGGRGFFSGTPIPITLSSGLTGVATVADPNGFNQTLNANLVIAATLPVVLADINATAKGCNGILNWRTSLELNMKNFEVEYSTNGVSFTKVGTVAALNASDGSTYSYVNNQGTAKGYYRIKMVNQSGELNYSKVVSVDTKCAGIKTISMFPNPLTTSQSLTVMASGYEGTVKGELVSMSGQIIRSYVLRNGTNTLPVDRLAQATYMLRVTDATGESESFRVVIIK